MATPRITLYDFASKGKNVAWNANVWKVRSYLNFKGLDYETQFIEYPDVAPTLSSAGVTPNATGTAYTLPTIRIGDEYFMDSKKIVAALEEKFPEPDAAFHDPKTEIILKASASAIQPLIPALVARMFNHLINLRSAEYMANKIQSTTTKPKEEEVVSEAMWTATREKWQGVVDLVQGPFVLGEKVSYADLVIVAIMSFVRRTGEDMFEEFASLHPEIKTIYEGCESYVQRNDH